MKLSLRHRLHATVDEFWRYIFEDEAFNRQLYADELGYGYELLESSVDGGERVVKVVPEADVPRAVAAVLGDRVSYIERGTYDRDAGRYSFEVVPSTFADRIRTQGVVRAEPDGDAACTRIVDLDIQARFPGVGKMIERYLAATTREQYEANTRFANAYLKDKLVAR